MKLLNKLTICFHKYSKIWVLESKDNNFETGYYITKCEKCGKEKTCR